MPRYQDTDESHVFVLSSAEDLVPVLVDGQCHEVVRTLKGANYRVQRYQPRIEGLFARIERWINRESSEPMGFHKDTINQDGEEQS